MVYDNGMENYSITFGYGVTFGADHSQVRYGNIPQVTATLCDATIGLMHWTGKANFVVTRHRLAARLTLKLIGARSWN